MPTIVELRQDRNLIRNNFDGYKLSLDTIPVLRRDLTSPPLKAELNEDQYSLLHAELFSMQNLLQQDPWARTSAYFVNRLGEVVRSAYDENCGRPEALQVVFRLSSSGAGEERIKGDYNYSMRFISEKYCVLCNGINHLWLLDTGDRFKATEWHEVSKTEINVPADSNQVQRNYMIYDCRLDIIQEQKQIALALGRVERIEGIEENDFSSHFMHMHWAQWIFKETWLFSILDTIEGKGSIYYCAFQPRAEALVLSSNREMKFRSQKTSVVQEEQQQQTNEKPQLHDEANQIFDYTWSQADDDIVIKFNTREGKDKNDYSIKCIGNRLTVKCNEEILLDKELYDKLDQDLTTWTIENNYLQITLMKEISNKCWPSLLKDGIGPKEVIESDRQCELPMEQKPIANLEAPIEDCDFPMGTLEDEIKIERFHLPTKTITHTVLLGSTPPLFATNLRAGFPLALVTRQDVDACLWLQQLNPSNPEEWSLRHGGNLHAFGYVQASKQQRKFIDCSPDMSYAIICESHRHIFLYKSSYDGANGLRNRNGPQVSIGKQHLITLETGDEILGIAAAQSVVTLLTETNILYLQIN